MLIILIGVLVVLSLIVILRQVKEPERPTLVEQAGFEKLIPDTLKKENIVKLELYAGAKPDQKVVLEKDGDKWRVTTHFNSPAKKETVEEYLDKILKLRGEFRAEVATDDALSDYNLKDDQAFYVSVFTSKEGEPALKLLVGKSPDFRLTFVRKAGERKIYDGGVNLRSEAGVYGDEVDKTPGPDKWLDKDIVRVEKDKITKLAYIMPDKKFTFERREKEVPVEQNESKKEGEEATSEGSSEGEKKAQTKKEYEWVLAEGGASERFKDSGLQNLLGRFNPLTATSIVDPAKKADWGLESPEFKLTISREGDSDIVIEGGRPDTSKGGYIRVATSQEDIVYELSKYMFEQIFPKGQDLFDLPSLNLDKEKIKQVEINLPESKVALKKENNNWQVVEPVLDLPLQIPTINTMVSALASWKPADYADNWAPVGEFNKSIVFTMEDNTKHTIKIADFSKSIDGSYATVDDNPLLMAVNKIDVNKVLLKPRDIYTLKVLDFDTEKVTAIEFQVGGEKESIKKGEGGWVLVKDSTEVALNEANVKDLLSNLDGLQGSDVRPDLKIGAFAPIISFIIHITDSEPIQFTVGRDPNGNIVSTVPRYKGILQLASEKWNEIQGLIDKAKEPKVEEKPASQEEGEGEKQASQSTEGENISAGETQTTTAQEGENKPEESSVVIQETTPSEASVQSTSDATSSANTESQNSDGNN